MRRKFLALAIPVLIESFLNTMSFYVNSAMLGCVGREAIATMGIVGPITYTALALVLSLGVGTVALVSRAVGSGDAKKMNEATSGALFVGFGIGFLLSVLGILFMSRAAFLFDVPNNPKIAQLASQYLFIDGFRLFFFTIEVVCAGIMRSFGNTRTPMIAGVIANILEAFLAYCLIFGNFGFPRMEVMGAAYAILISQIVYALIVFVLIFTKVSGVGLSLTSLKTTRESVRNLFKVTIPALIEPIVERTGFMMYHKIVTTLGHLPLATHRAAITIESITYLPGHAFSTSCSVLVGQSLGEKSVEKARLSLHQGARYACYFMCFIGVLFLFIPHIFMGLFAPRDEEVIALGSLILAISAFEQPFFALSFVLYGSLRGAGDTKSPVFVSFVGVWLVRIPLCYILAYEAHLGLVGVWITMSIDWFIRALLLYAIWKRGNWRKIKL